MRHKKQSIPNKLWKYRKIMGFKQTDVAQKLKLRSSSMVSRWEKGLCMPSSEDLLKLSILYKTLPHELYANLITEYHKEFAAPPFETINDP
jgi:transcriptional regulator with XRE-family HTH domain